MRSTNFSQGDISSLSPKKKTHLTSDLKLEISVMRDPTKTDGNSEEIKEKLRKETEDRIA